MTRPGFEPAPPASEADALTIMLSGPVYLKIMGDIFVHSLDSIGNHWEIKGVSAQFCAPCTGHALMRGKSCSGLSQLEKNE